MNLVSYPDELRWNLWKTQEISPESVIQLRSLRSFAYAAARDIPQREKPLEELVYYYVKNKNDYRISANELTKKFEETLEWFQRDWLSLELANDYLSGLSSLKDVDALSSQLYGPFSALFDCLIFRPESPNPLPRWCERLWERLLADNGEDENLAYAELLFKVASASEKVI